VLFSEPKIPQLLDIVSLPFVVVEFQCSSASRKFLNPARLQTVLLVAPVSVLFSEPKIPQLWYSMSVIDLTESFSALQRAENSSMTSK